MTKYEKIFMEIIQLYIVTGIWIVNKDLKVGFNYVEIHETDCGFNDFYDELDECSADDMTVQSYFEYHPKLKFCFTLDKALEGNFISWKEFCERVDNKESFSDVASL